ncbi:MAG: nicotinamide-nucleotide amidohydrolase family protein [Candidatus Lokiarchaeota archaeon]|nr:nicotinamide-nucleotide amidohydrolase family protein [Candidatus Lokiarchaeota archaeon]MBD3198446.1 nicotinamide-nucleotide amidohydrolase family protein [Candidatus Lokiarchaeota archaeon]
MYTEKNKKVAFAESCTGGYICHMITNISGSSEVFERGIVCYSNDSKEELLKVPHETLIKHGAVSEQVADKLCRGIRKISNVNVGIGITGIAGPTGGTAEKPVGLVYIGISTESIVNVYKYIIKKERIKFKKEVLKKVLVLLDDYIKI